jgi:DNA-binding NarL/FixJ family response regulator
MNKMLLTLPNNSIFRKMYFLIESKEGVAVNVLLHDKLYNVRDLFSGFSPPIKLFKYSERNQLGKYAREEKMMVDMVVMEKEENHRFQISQLKELRKFNPDIRAILYTSQSNRKYRSIYLNNGFDFFIFNESEEGLLEEIIKRVHRRKTLVS